MTDKAVISRIAQGDLKAFEWFYDHFRDQFIALMMANYSVKSKEEALDLYQMACANTYNNIRSGRLTAEKLNGAKLSTYLNALGKYDLFAKRKKKAVPLVLECDQVLKLTKENAEDTFLGNDRKVDEGAYDIAAELDEKEDQLFIIRKTVELMTGPCSELLDLKVYQQKKNSEIAHIMGYKNEQSVSTQIHKCREKLIETVKRRIQEYGYGNE